MGAKTGYAAPLLRVLGLRPGQRAARYLWCEPDAGVRLLLETYRDADLAREVAAIIRSWADEEPRTLWDRLRAEGPPRCTEAREVARWLNLQGWTMQPGDRFRHPFGGYSQSGAKSLSGCDGLTSKGLANRAEQLRGLPATVAPDARQVDPSTLPSGTVVYMDPPYQDTTGYAHDLPRSQVVELAERWSAAGATVAISEAVGLAADLEGQWFEVDITGERRGQKRTFSRQQREVVTLNRPPAWRPSVQATLFGAA
jgi:3D (Asp-Asp-Asp) domain-containing protein